MGLWESILGFRNQFGPKDVDVWYQVVNIGPLGLLGVDFGLGILEYI